MEKFIYLLIIESQYKTINLMLIAADLFENKIPIQWIIQSTLNKVI